MSLIINPEFEKTQTTYRASTEDVLFQLQEIKKKIEENDNTQLLNITTQIKEATTQSNGYQQYALVQDLGVLLGRTNFMYQLYPGASVDINVFNGQRCFNYLLVIISENVGEIGSLEIFVSNDMFGSNPVKCKLEDLQEITAHPNRLPPFNLHTQQIYRMDLKGITKVKLNSFNTVSAVVNLNFVV